MKRATRRASCAVERRAVATPEGPSGPWAGGPVPLLAVTLPLGVLYLVTLCPTIFSGDAAEMATAGATFGIPHPPGYPLYCLLANLWCRLLPLGEDPETWQRFWAMVSSRVYHRYLEGGFSAERLAFILGGLYRVCGDGVCHGLGCDAETCLTCPQDCGGCTWKKVSGARWNGASLLAVWGSSATNVFAVGDWGTIVQYDGTQWSPMTSPTKNRLNSVWGSSPSDVFAVGDAGTLLGYDGKAWSLVTADDPRGINVQSSASVLDLLVREGEVKQIVRRLRTTDLDIGTATGKDALVPQVRHPSVALVAYQPFKGRAGEPHGPDRSADPDIDEERSLVPPSFLDGVYGLNQSLRRTPPAVIAE